MSYRVINIGSGEGAGDGDSIRLAFEKSNSNFEGADNRLQVLETGVVRADGTVTGNIVPDTDVTYDLGSSSKKFKDLYLSGNTITLGNQTISSSASGINTSGNFTTTGTIQATTITSTAPSNLSGSFTGDLKGSVYSDGSATMIDGVAGLILGDVRNTYVETGNIILSGNTIGSSSGDLNVAPTGSVNITTGLSVQGHADLLTANFGPPGFEYATIDSVSLKVNKIDGPISGLPGAVLGISSGTGMELRSAGTIDIEGDGGILLTGGEVTPGAGPSDVVITGGPISMNGGLVINCDDVTFNSGSGTVDFGFTTVDFSSATVNGLPATTTINNNADNRIITGSATANTLNAETGITFNNNRLLITSAGGVDTNSINAHNIGNNEFLELRGGASTGGIKLQYYNSGWQDAILIDQATSVMQFDIPINAKGDIGIERNTTGTFEFENTNVPTDDTIQANGKIRFSGYNPEGGAGHWYSEIRGYQQTANGATEDGAGSIDFAVYTNNYTVSPQLMQMMNITEDGVDIVRGGLTFSAGTTADFTNATVTGLPTDISQLTDSTNSIPNAVEAHLNTGTATASQLLSWSGSDYYWVDPAVGGVDLTAFSVGAEASASGDGGIAYDNSTGVFTYTPPDLSGYQATLVSGTNIKTINGTSLLGSGDVTISGGGGTLGALSDVNNTAPSWNNQPLVWDGSSEWKPGSDLTAVNLRAFTKLTLDGQGTYIEWIGTLSPPFYTIKLNITGNATQNETITLPNATGTIALTSDIPTDVGDLTDTGGLLSGGGADLSAVNQNYTPDTDNAYDLGIAAGNFLRSGYFKTSVVIDNATLTYNAQGELESSAGIKTGNLRTYGLYSDAYMSIEPKYGGLIFWMDGDPGGGTLANSGNNGSNEMTWSGDLYSNGPTYQLDKDQANLQIGAEVTKTISGVTLGATTSLNFSDPYYANPNSTVTITGVVGTTELNNQTYYINSSNELFTDAALTTPLNSSAFTAYVSGGTAVVAPRATASLPVLHSAPTTPKSGMMAVADGTNWNPTGTGTETMVVYLGGAWRTIANA